MSIPKFLSNLCRCVCVCVHVCADYRGCRDPAPLFSHLGLLTSSESMVIGTAGQLHNYHLLQTAFVFDVVPHTTMPSLSSSLSSPHKVLITKAITICIQTTVSQTVG